MCFDLAHIDVEDKVINGQEVLFFLSGFALFPKEQTNNIILIPLQI